VRGDATASFCLNASQRMFVGPAGPREPFMAYRITGLDPAPYKTLFELSDDDLAKRGIVSMIVTQKPSFPCRISLVDRDIGEKVLLLNHVSHDVANPYRAAHAIFVADAERGEFVDEIPPIFQSRILSLRGFDKAGMMADAVLAEPGEAEAAIRRLLDNPVIDMIHAHNATRGCFSAKIERH
jgi:uncharacterized protein DUF1203